MFVIRREREEGARRSLRGRKAALFWKVHYIKSLIAIIDSF